MTEKIIDDPVEPTELQEPKEPTEPKELEEPEEPEELGEYTQEELDELWAKHEASQLKEWGLPQFKTYEEMAKNFGKFLDEDKMVFPIVKELASKYQMTPQQFMQGIQAQLEAKESGVKPGEKPKGEAPDDSKYKELKGEIDKIYLDNLFSEFRQRMKEQEIDIPHGLKPKLAKLLPAVVAGKSQEEIEESLLFDEAYELHMFKLSKEKNPKKLKEELKALEKVKMSKLKQLGMPAGKKTTKGYTSQDVKDYGEGITKL